MRRTAVTTTIGNEGLAAKTPYDWAWDVAGIKQPGILLTRGRFHFFITDGEAIQLAHLIADHIEESNR